MPEQKAQVERLSDAERYAKATRLLDQAMAHLSASPQFKEAIITAYFNRFPLCEPQDGLSNLNLNRLQFSVAGIPYFVNFSSDPLDCRLSIGKHLLSDPTPETITIGVQRIPGPGQLLIGRFQYHRTSSDEAKGLLLTNNLAAEEAIKQFLDENFA